MSKFSFFEDYANKEKGWVRDLCLEDMKVVNDEGKGFWKLGWWRSPRGRWDWGSLNCWRGWLDLSGLISLCWVSLCLLRSTFLWNDLAHMSHENGLYPVCFLVWVIRLLLWLNALPQTMHLCGFSPAKRIRLAKLDLLSGWE